MNARSYYKFCSIDTHCLSNLSVGHGQSFPLRTISRQLSTEGCISIRDRDLKLEILKLVDVLLRPFVRGDKIVNAMINMETKAQSAGEFYERLLIPQYAAEFSFTVIAQLIF